MMASQMLAYSLVGSEKTIRKGWDIILKETQADEIMSVGAIYDIEARIKSFEILSKFIP